ncbi:hypothetical protein FOYG_17510 [Fusarium oxysporum NRRL 32931]|uniref:Cytochrome P450 oxidoreductase n=1 Tax=Fusarium oxysporum NRRL 32931 TaxID=660029 RepID=W9HGK7_FUSOX|nr:hypothetical protein FOYG_17510 [Fusarium oxysporum NRRL 32931]
MPGKQIEGLFRRSSSLVPTPSLFDALTIFFGLSGRDIHIFNHDRISAYEASVGFYTDHPDVSRRIMEHQRRDFAHYLQGRNLVFVMERFKKNLASELSAASEVGHDWGRIPDLFSFLSNLILRANVEALYGEHLLRICPTFCQDFWNFYKAFPNISKGLPRWLVPSSYQARDEMHKSFDRWRTWCSENYNWDNDGLRDIEYEPIWGTQYVRKMIQRHEALGLSNNGVAVVMLGYFFVYVHDLPSGKPQHPLEGFWAERFLDCPGSSSISGPAKKKRVQPVRKSPQRPTTQMETEDAPSKASVAGLRGHFFPFGGGAFRCPGETLAKHVIFASVAMVLQSHDLRLIDPVEARKIEPGHRELPFGLHSFDKPVPVEICKLSET